MTAVPRASAMTYHELFVANLKDLRGPAARINPRVALIAVYSELEALFSNLLPDALPGAAAAAERGGSAPGAEAGVLPIGRAIDRVAWECGCGGVLDLGRQAYRARHDDRHEVSIGDVDAAVALVQRFVARAESATHTLRCACCGAGVEYRLRDLLNVCPPARYPLRCPACEAVVNWFVPSPREQ